MLVMTSHGFAGPIFLHPFVVEVILPFLLVFVLVFALLQKSSILGKDKRQIDAIIALVIGLIVVVYANAVNIILVLMPFLAVTAVIILVFLILFSMVYAEGEFKLHMGVKIGFGVVIGLALLIAVLLITGAWDYLYDLIFFSGSQSSWVSNIIFAVIIVIAFAVVLLAPKKEAG